MMSSFHVAALKSHRILHYLLGPLGPYIKTYCYSLNIDLYFFPLETVDGVAKFVTFNEQLQ